MTDLTLKSKLSGAILSLLNLFLMMLSAASGPINSGSSDASGFMLYEITEKPESVKVAGEIGN